MRNVLDKVPDKAYDDVLAAVGEIYHAKSEIEAKELTRAFVARYRSVYPKAVNCLQEARDQLFAYFRFPPMHGKSLKTTNPLFSVVKLRAKAARRLRTRMSAVCLVFQVLKQSERRIRRINGYTIVARTIDAMTSRAPKVRLAA